MHFYTASISHMGVHDFKKRALDKTFNKKYDRKTSMWLMIHSVRGNYDVKRQTKQELNYRLGNVCSNDKTAELQKKNK